MENNKTTGISIAGLVLGIISLLCGCLAFAVSGLVWLGLICGIVGIILSVIGRKKDHSGAALGGLITSIIGLVICVISLIIACVAVMMFVGAINSLAGTVS